MKARYQHDCKACKFFGNLNRYDLYTCEQGGDGEFPTIVARYGSKREDYLSGERLTLDSITVQLNVGWRP